MAEANKQSMMCLYVDSRSKAVLTVDKNRDRTVGGSLEYVSEAKTKREAVTKSAVPGGVYMYRYKYR